MDRKTEVCGIQLDNLSLPEAMTSIEEFFGRGRLYTVDYVYAELLKLLVQEEELKNSVIAGTDLMLIGEKAVAQVLDVPCMMTEEELDRQQLANQFLQYCEQEQKTIYWIGETEESYEQFRAYADKVYPQMQVVGAFAVGEDLTSEMEEALINDINCLTPDVIVSKLPSPYQEQFISRQKMKLNAQVWLGISSKANLSVEAIPASSKIKALIDKTLLKRVVNANKEG